MKEGTVLIVDDEPLVTDLLSEDLNERGYNCVTAFSGDEALERLTTDNINVILLDLKLPGISGMDVLREVVSTYPTAIVIIITAVGDAQTAIEAMKIGATDYIIKPFELKTVNSSIEKALQKTPVWTSKSAPDADSGETRNIEVDWTSTLNAIARGVKIRLEQISAHSLTVTEETIAIAQSLDVPEDEINRWADARLKQNAEQSNAIDSLLKKLKQTPTAQIVLGMTEPYQCSPGHESRLN